MKAAGLCTLVSGLLALLVLRPACSSADERLTGSSASGLLDKAAEIAGSAIETAHRRLQQVVTAAPPQLVPFDDVLIPRLQNVGAGRPVTFKNFESAGSVLLSSSYA